MTTGDWPAEAIRHSVDLRFQYNQPWTPNLNARNRLVPNPGDDRLLHIPEITIDLKEDVTLSWL